MGIAVLVDNALEILSLFVAVAALVYAALAFRSARHTNQTTKDSDRTALRLKVEDSIAKAESSLTELQAVCNTTRNLWEVHFDRHYPAMGRNFRPPEETRHILELERAGVKLFHALRETIPEEKEACAMNFEEHIKQANATSAQIERLKLRLETPRPLWH